MNLNLYLIFSMMLGFVFADTPDWSFTSSDAFAKAQSTKSTDVDLNFDVNTLKKESFLV